MNPHNRCNRRNLRMAADMDHNSKSIDNVAEEGMGDNTEIVVVVVAVVY